MEVYVDGENWNEDVSGENLLDILGDIKCYLDDRIIGSLEVDGEEYDCNLPGDNPAASDIQVIEIETRDPVDIAEKTFMDVQCYLPRVINGFNSSLEALRVGEEKAGFDELHETLKGLDWCIEVMDNLTQLTQESELENKYLEMKKDLNIYINKITREVGQPRTEEVIEVLDEELLEALEELEELIRKLACHYSGLWS